MCPDSNLAVTSSCYGTVDEVEGRLIRNADGSAAVDGRELGLSGVCRFGDVGVQEGKQ